MPMLPDTMTSTMLAFWTPGPWELGALAVIALLLFGRRLPDVARSFGRSIVEFRKGIKGIEDEVEEASNKPKVSSGPAGTLPSDSQSAGSGD